MSDETHSGTSYGRRLLHRWLVEYNPLYLLSASLVLGGMILCSRGLAHEGSLYGEVGVAAIAELYAGALIAGAALLTRIGQRRPAVMLALLTALYQCDLTLHTETCVFLGGVGVVAGALWVLLFIAKLYALAWAVRLRLSTSATAVATFGALGLALLPHALGRLDPHAASVLVAFWLFAVFTLGLRASRAVTSAVPLDGWGQTVLRRALRAVWLMWSVLLVFHVVFWSMNYPVRLAALAPVTLLLGTRWIGGEARLWAAVTGTLVLVGLTLPELFSVSALMAAIALGARALWLAPRAAATEPERVDSPYRAAGESPPAIANAPAAGEIAPPSPAARWRLLTGALFGVYLAVWTLGWTGGRWPSHLVLLDALLTAVVVVLVVRPKVRVALAPLAASYLHFAVQASVLSAPQSILQWGAASVGLGFALLISSLGASYWLRNAAVVRGPGPASGVDAVTAASEQQRNPIW